ncbi:uncharacterized protein LOC110656298 isoform X2 [Hevea brasiliensis]|uniref:uncharacterized protein LOC110656298 isoform X2 n=1 Tax=Hevea brasiliensis TaxID=3981 RepID=UPI0025D70DF5|nr:uncharacterized protein LOC110656298 isoform X2 [Hevea brasiliensis]
MASVGNVFDENIETSTVSNLISSLKSAFQSSYFSEVESVLVTREQKLKHEIEVKAKENEQLKKKNELFQLERLEKLRVENELKRCVRECLKLRELNSRLTEELNELNDRLQGAALDKQAIIELKRKNCELECSRLKAETESDVYKRKFEELELRVSSLEKDTVLLMSLDLSPSTIARVSREFLGEKAVGENEKSCDKLDNVQIQVGVIENVPWKADGNPSCLVPEDGGGNLKITGATCISPENMDADNVCLSYGVTEEKRMSENEEVESKTNSGCISEKHVDLVPKGPGYCHRPDENGTGSGKPNKAEIVQIIDSDDDSCPCEILGTEEMATTKHSGQAVAENGTGTGVLKRKWASSVNKGESGNEEKDNAQDADDSCTTGKHNITKLQKIICMCNSSPAKNCSAAAMSYETNNSGREFTPSKPAFLLQFEKKMGADNKSQNQKGDPFMDGSDSSSSSDSEYEWDLSVDFSRMNKSWQRGQGNGANKRWELEADMIATFEKDGELCMEAVCALYRQQTSVRKSICGSSSSENRGFNKLAATRGTTLAEFLIDGDPQGKLKKSKTELMAYNHKGLDDCRRLAIGHSKQLFEIYQKQEDSLFLN